jgi:hypothetical protein
MGGEFGMKGFGSRESEEIGRDNLMTARPTTVAWGWHFREGREIGYGSVKSIEDGDLVHIELPESMPEIGKPKDGHVGVEYTLGTSTHVHSVRVKTSNTIEETLAQIRKKHPGVSMEQVQVAGAEVDGNQPITDWLSRSTNHPLQIIIGPLVEVRIL